MRCLVKLGEAWGVFDDISSMDEVLIFVLAGEGSGRSIFLFLEWVWNGSGTGRKYGFHVVFMCLKRRKSVFWRAEVVRKWCSFVSGMGCERGGCVSHTGWKWCIRMVGTVRKWLFMLLLRSVCGWFAGQRRAFAGDLRAWRVVKGWPATGYQVSATGESMAGNPLPTSGQRVNACVGML